MITYMIPLIPISKKNSQQIMRTKNGRPFIMPSKQYREYERNAQRFLQGEEAPIDYPVNISCRFYMPTRRRCDLVNLLEAVDDILVKAGIIADDNYCIVAGHDGSRVMYDKDNPRTEIYITKEAP